MKKLISITLVLTFLLAALSTLAPIASAADTTISESEAKELIVKAYEFCRNVRGGYAHIHENSDEYRIDVDYGGKYPEYYYKVIEENLPGGSYEKMCEYVETIYTKDIAPKAYAYKWTYIVNPSDGMWDKLKSFFYRNESGVLYANTSHLSYRGVNLFPDAENVQIEIVSGDSKTAKANVHVKFFQVDGPRAYNYDIVECRFENTADGWRIAESEYSLALSTEAVYLEDYRAKNPDAPNPSGDGILIPDVREILLPVIAELEKDIDEYYYPEFCNDSAVDRLVAGCKASTEKIGDEYVVTVNGEKPFRFIYDPENTRIEIVESTDKEATVLVYFDFIDGDKTVSTPVECKFSKGYSLWMLEDSQIIDLLTNPDEFAPSPDTGDRAFDTLTLCLGGMAIVISVVCFARRRRIEE
jgi:hypothetical protein